jgi:hypothetical protein
MQPVADADRGVEADFGLASGGFDVQTDVGSAGGIVGIRAEEILQFVVESVVVGIRGAVEGSGIGAGGDFLTVRIAVAIGVLGVGVGEMDEEFVEIADAVVVVVRMAE